ncbi:MAG TPA: gamma-glutamyl-gamma-aminobutyrate hydrolase family protein [Bacteroidota bacterium]|nr:gamma-glutamyl-gamma-aminobutyrate hydrolase family protein [Bacteroidota bacterium]
MIIGITDPMRDAATFEGYAALARKWIPGVEVQILSCVTGTFSEIGRCDALLLTGGGDIHPKFYSRDEDVALAREVKIGRDLFEFDVIREAMERGIPVLGICRGFQVFNVAMGGSLLPDIEAAGLPSHRREDERDRMHGVRVVKGSLLHSITGETEGTVNSSHHQAVDAVGRGLKVAARSDDGVIEALEWEEPAGKPFLMLVQWHPERLGETEAPFSRNLIERLAAEARVVRTV